MKKLLLITTATDHSAENFSKAAEANNFEIETHFYSNLNIETLTSALSSQKYAALYLRDPFNENLDINDITTIVTTLLEATSENTYVVDSVRSMEDLLLEDKWKQYQLYMTYMPQTVLYQQRDALQPPLIYKRRISSRSRGIFFNEESIDTPGDGYIAQQILPIIEEYRVFAVSGEVISTIAVRSSKTRESKLKMSHPEAITPALLEFTHTVLHGSKLDLVGLDIVKTAEGYKLLEINRSPQFSTFSEKSDCDVANLLLTALSKKLA